MEDLNHGLWSVVRFVTPGNEPRIVDQFAVDSIFRNGADNAADMPVAPDGFEHTPRSPAVWSKSTRFNDDLTPAITPSPKKAILPAIHSNEHLEALESCL